MFKGFIRLSRPEQWTKNILILAGIIFAGHLHFTREILYVIIAFITFCLLSSGGYVINDIIDLEKDKMHPQKTQSPSCLRKNKSIPCHTICHHYHYYGFGHLLRDIYKKS